MIESKTRNGKELFDFKLSELVDEYRKINQEGGRLVSTAIELRVLDIKKQEVEELIKEYNNYASEIAKEFIKRFL